MNAKRPTKPKTEREHAILVAKVLLRVPNIDKDSDLAVLARQFLVAMGEV